MATAPLELDGGQLCVGWAGRRSPASRDGFGSGLCCGHTHCAALSPNTRYPRRPPVLSSLANTLSLAAAQPWASLSPDGAGAQAAPS